MIADFNALSCCNYLKTFGTGYVSSFKLLTLVFDVCTTVDKIIVSVMWQYGKLVHIYLYRPIFNVVMA